MANKLFQLVATVLLVVLLIRIVGGNEQPLIKWIGGRWGQAAVKTTGFPATPSPTKSAPQQPPKQVGCPTGTSRTDSIYLGEALALQFKKQSKQFATTAQIETQLGQPNCKGAAKSIWMTADGKALAARQQGSKVQVSFSGF